MKKTDNGFTIQQHADVAYEPRDINPRTLFTVAGAILVFLVIVHFSVSLMFNHLAATDRQKALQPSTLVRGDQMTKPPEPQLQTDPPEDLQAMRAAEEEVLHSYGWVDQPSGIVRIPIEQAMKVLVEEGLPGKSQP